MAAWLSSFTVLYLCTSASFALTRSSRERESRCFSLSICDLWSRMVMRALLLAWMYSFTSCSLSERSFQSVVPFLASMRSRETWSSLSLSSSPFSLICCSCSRWWACCCSQLSMFFLYSWISLSVALISCSNTASVSLMSSASERPPPCSPCSLLFFFSDSILVRARRLSAMLSRSCLTATMSSLIRSSSSFASKTWQAVSAMHVLPLRMRVR
mmetsp:Transcript_95483/g.279229  ORF Transcript_95483/g.279229 Transcript_95483/m.279229 type:complete len:213 (+) Transcript_95483:549-1187(+)